MADYLVKAGRHYQSGIADDAAPVGVGQAITVWRWGTDRAAA